MCSVAELRDSVLKNIPDPRQGLDIDNLISLTDNVHSSWLFCEGIGTATRRAICSTISSIPNGQQGNWCDLAGALGLKYTLIAIIQYNDKVFENAKLALHTYSQYPNSTIGQIIKALDKIERFDVISQMRVPVIKLVDDVRREQQKRQNIIESGIRAIEGPQQSRQALQIIMPVIHNFIKSKLLDELIDNEVDGDNNSSSVCKLEHDRTRTWDPPRIKESHVRSAPVPSKPNFKVTVFLTFAADGEVAANRIAKKLLASQGSREGFGVLILDWNREKILSNPEMIIPKLFFQVHYVMPIITKGYMNAIHSEVNPMRSGMETLDVSYTQFIHDLMVKSYMENNCRNNRFRCIIPDTDEKEEANIMGLLNMMSGYSDATLRIWTHERKLESLAQRMAGIYD